MLGEQGFGSPSAPRRKLAPFEVGETLAKTFAVNDFR